MKYITIKVVMGMLAVASLTMSCKDSYLDPDPRSLYEPTATFSSQAGLDAALASADKGLKAYWTNTTAIDLQLPLMSESMMLLPLQISTNDLLLLKDISMTTVIA